MTFAKMFIARIAGFLFLALFITGKDCQLNNTFILGVISSTLSQSLAIPAAYYARLEIERRQLLKDYEIDFIFAETRCDGRVGMKSAVEMRLQARIDALIGCSCSSVCLPVGLLAAAWNLPEISYYCYSELLSDKSVYPTFTRTVGTFQKFLAPTMDILEAFGWNRLAIIAGPGPSFEEFCKLLKTECESRGWYVTYNFVDAIMDGDKVSEERLAIQRGIVRDIKARVRVIFILSYMTDLRAFLVTCSDEGMMNGEYAFLGLETAFFRDSYMTFRPEMTDNLIRQGMIAIITEDGAGGTWDKYMSQTSMTLWSLESFTYFLSTNKTTRYPVIMPTGKKGQHLA